MNTIKVMLRYPLTWVVLVILVGVIAYAMYLFQPWRFFTTVEVDEALPTVSQPAVLASSDPAATEKPAEPKVLSKGTFRSHEHGTKGGAMVVQLADGSRVLRIENLDTSDGPDLRVWLSDQPVTGDWFNFDDGKYVELGELKGNKGNANYAIPASADLDKLRSVTIWCKRFSVSFGAAALK